MKVCEFTTTTTTAQISIQVGQNVGAYITARDSATPIAGQVSNTNDFVYFSSYAGLAAGNYDLHFEDTATPLKFNITAITNATITEIDFSELPFLTTVNISSVSSAVANAAVPSLWAAYGENVPYRGALTTPTLSGEAANIAAILQDFYGWTLNGTELWQIVSTITELEAISEGLAGNYKLANDIDMGGAGAYWENLTDGVVTSYSTLNVSNCANYYTSYFIGILDGTLDGCGHSIRNLTFAGDSTTTGISFARTGTTGCIKNLKFDNINIYSEMSTGTVSAIATIAVNSGRLSKVAVYGTCVANAARKVGLLMAGNAGKVDNCQVEGYCFARGGLVALFAGVQEISANNPVNCIAIGESSNSTFVGVYGGSALNCYYSGGIDDLYATGLTIDQLKNPANLQYVETGTEGTDWYTWTEALATAGTFDIGIIAFDGTYYYVSEVTDNTNHPSTLIGWERLGFDFTGTRQGNGYDYGLVGVETAGEVWPGTATQIPQADGSYLDLATGERVVNTTGDNWTVVDLREVWKMVAGEPRLRWEQFGGARSRMSGIAFDLRYSRTTGGARVV